jgi:hypothetical protein
MYESNNKKVQKIVNLIQSHGCIVEGKKISLDALPLLCHDLNDSDKKEIGEIIQSIDDELSYLYGERQQLDIQIQSLEAAREKLAQLVQTVPINNSNENSTPSQHWFVHNWESESFFPTQVEAIAQATSDLAYCRDPDDGTWSDYVEDIYVGYVTHQAKPSAAGYSLRSISGNERTSDSVFTDRELAMILAGLRSIQNYATERSITMPHDHFYDCTPLSPDEVDKLCDRLNR